MAGGAITKQRLAALDAIPERLWQLVDEGKSLRQMARELEAEGVTTSKSMLHLWFGRDEESKQRWKAACKSRAWDFAEKSVEVLEQVDENEPAKVPLAREKARNYQWMAEKLDQEQFGNRPQVNVQVNLAEAFVQVMRERA